MQIIHFGTDEIANELAGLSEQEFNDLAFGAILLDKKGTILRFNATEGEICKRDPAEMIGRNFFTDVAPCTNTDEFRGKFDEGVASGKLNVVFRYLFDYRMPETNVQVHMKKNSVGSESYWVIVKRV